VGAIDIHACPIRTVGGTCQCIPKCKQCGHGPHMAVHGPLYGAEPGTAPYDHEYAPKRDVITGAPRPIHMETGDGEQT